ncbi:MAG TPA: hypothetical protein VD884_00300 [Ohtaekwangia sp.]|nr:hypothetical protein [Ohtaekwangia sp.]
MKNGERAREEIFEVIKNQMEGNDPPETKITYDRLRNQGYNDLQTKQLIGQCIAVELFEMLKFRKPYNRERYLKNLKRLPKEPFD